MSRREILRRTGLGAIGVGAGALVGGCRSDHSPRDTEQVLGLTFPAGFAWGAATSAYQIEGAVHADGRGPSIWDTFSHTQGKIVDNSSGDVACDHYHRWAEDLDLMKRLGLRSYRFSIAWPRIMPSGRGQVNQKGVDFYKRLVDGLHQRGIAPLATLFHWDLPQALQDDGGWENRDCAKWFTDYADVMFRQLGTAVSTWLTTNEPKTIVQVGYEYGSMAPGKQDRQAAAVVSHHLALAHGSAVRAFRATGQAGRIGPALNLAPVYPASSSSEEAKTAAVLADGVENRMYLDPIFKGSYPSDVHASLAPDVRAALDRATRSGDFDIISSPVDLLGVNYYNPVFVGPSGNYVTLKPTSAASWEQIYPAGLTDVLMRIAHDYGNVPMVVTENGTPDPGDITPSDGAPDDRQRIDFVRDHLRAAHDAIARGAKLEGYHVWSLLDNFEWAQGYTQRWGIVHVDFDTQRRTLKRSATWYRDVIARNGI